MLYGIVLAGGLSKRYGTCKTKLLLEKKSILEKTHNLLSNHTDKVYVSCREENKIDGYPCIYDKKIAFAPICGIAACLEFLQAPILVLSCDMPFVDNELLALLVAERNKAIRENPQLCLTTYQNKDTRYIESLVAIYEYRALPLLLEGIATENYALHKVLPTSLRHHIPFTDLNPFFNINYPQDLKEAETLLIQNKTLADKF